MRRLAESYPVQVVCWVWEMPRSTSYYHTQASDEQELQAALQRLSGQWPRNGLRRLTAQLQREGFQVNRKHIQCLMREWGLQGQQYAKKGRTTNNEHPFPRYPNLVVYLEIVRPEQVRVSDVIYIRLQDVFVYLAALMDVFTRSIQGWHLGRSLCNSYLIIDHINSRTLHRLSFLSGFPFVYYDYSIFKFFFLLR
jgi:putative transposase